MSDPNEAAGSGRPGAGAAGFSAARGAALVALAVIIGIVLLQAIDDGNDGPVGDGGSSSATTSVPASSSDTGAGDTSGTTAATPTTVPPAFVTVRVLNGSGVSGAAGQLTNSIKAKGYQTLVAGDAASREGNVVYYAADRKAECTTLAEEVPNSPKVQEMPADVPGGEDANCIVILGT